VFGRSHGELGRALQSDQVKS